MLTSFWSTPERTLEKKGSPKAAQQKRPGLIRSRVRELLDGVGARVEHLRVVPPKGVEADLAVRQVQLVGAHDQEVLHVPKDELLEVAEGHRLVRRGHGGH